MNVTSMILRNKFQSASKLANFLLDPFVTNLFHHVVCDRIRTRVQEIEDNTTTPPDIQVLQKLAVIVTLCAHATRKKESVRGIPINFNDLEMAYASNAFEFEYDESLPEPYWSTSGSMVLPVKARIQKTDGTVSLKEMVVKITLFEAFHTFFRDNFSSSFGARFHDYGYDGFLSEAHFLTKLNEQIEDARPSGFKTCEMYNYGILKMYDYYTFGVMFMSRLRGVTLNRYLTRRKPDELQLAVELTNKIMLAIQDMHDKLGVIHNDLHRGNIYYAEDTQEIQIFDFGRSYFYCPDDSFSEHIRKFDDVSDITHALNCMLKIRDYLYVFFRQSNEQQYLHNLRSTDTQCSFSQQLQFHAFSGIHLRRTSQLFNVVHNTSRDFTKMQDFFGSNHADKTENLIKILESFEYIYKMLITERDTFNPQIFFHHESIFDLKLTKVVLNIESYFEMFEEYEDMKDEDEDGSDSDWDP